MSDQQKPYVINLIFGQNGVTAADTRVVFKEHLAEATSQANEITSLGPTSHHEYLLSFNPSSKQQSNLISPQMPLQDGQTIAANQLIMC